MKKFILILVVLCVVFMGCSNPAGGIDDSPAARLQGRWYVYGNNGPTANHYIEFSGNIMREYMNIGDRQWNDSGPFTCTETVITVDLFGDYYGDGNPFYRTFILHYTIDEETIRGITYPNVLRWNSSDFWPEGGSWIKLDTPLQR